MGVVNKEASALTPAPQKQEQQMSSPEHLALLTQLKAKLYDQVAELYGTIDLILDTQAQQVMQQVELEKQKLQEEEERKFSEVAAASSSGSSLVSSKSGASSGIDFKKLDTPITLNVGGVIYKTTLMVLRRKPCTLLALMFSGDYELTPMNKNNEEPVYFIDRNGKLFKYVLDYLRDGVVVLPSEEEDEELRERIIREAKFYGIDLDESEDGVDDNDDSFDAENFVLFDWRLNPNKKHPNLQLSNGGLTVTHNGSGHATVVGTDAMRFGVHKWGVRIDGPSHWVGVGICQLTNLKADMSSDYDHMWGASSQNQHYKTTGPLVTWPTGETLICTFDADTGKFTIESKTKTTNVTAQNLVTNQDYYPMINLYSAGNKVTIIDPEEFV